MMMTGGDGWAASLNILAASSRLSTNLRWPSSSILDTPVVRTGGLELMVGLVQVVTSTVGEEVEETEDVMADGRTVVARADDEGAGAEKLRRTPAKPDSTL